MRRGRWMGGVGLALAFVSGAGLAQEGQRTFVTELTISRIDGQQRTTVLNQFTLIGAQGKTQAIQVGPDAVKDCPTLDRAGCAAPAPGFGQLRGTLQVAPVAQASMGGFAATSSSASGLFLIAHLVASPGDGQPDRTLNLQSPLALYQPTVIGADVVNGQAIVYTVKISEPNEVSVIK
jgi:hypothetical protein